MSQLPPDVEQRLVIGYREQLRLYDQALALTDNANTQDWVFQLNELLRKIAEIDATEADDQAAFRQAGPQSGELSNLVERLAGRLVSLRQRIDGETQRLQERRAQMLPEIDEFIQRRRMVAAYGRYGDRHPHVA